MKRNERGTVTAYNLSSQPESGNGQFDGYLRLIAAVAKQARKEGCKCNGCQRWVELAIDWTD